MIGGEAAHLLGRHVADGAEHHRQAAVPGDSVGSVAGIDRRVGAVLEQLGQAEVQNLDAAVGGDEEVLRLQVAMDDALLVRRRQAVRDLRRRSRPPCAPAAARVAAARAASRLRAVPRR